MATFKLFSLNTYLIPKYFTKHHSQTYQRATEIGKMSVEHDISFFQEVWGSGVDYLQNPSRICPPYRCMPFVSGPLATFAHSVWFRMNAFGGLYFNHSPSVKLLSNNHRKFSKSATASGKGVECAYFDMEAIEKDAKLMVFNLHLDRAHYENKIHQLNEIKEFVTENVAKAKENTSILLLGDFNFKSTSKEYKLIVDMFGDGNMKDLYKECHAEETNTYDAECNSMAGFKEDTGRIDHVFNILSINGREFRPISALKFDVLRQPSKQEVSDHWGLSLSLIFD